MADLHAGDVGGQSWDALTADADHGRERRESFLSETASRRLAGQGTGADPGDVGGGEAPTTDAGPPGHGRIRRTSLLSRTTTNSRSIIERTASTPLFKAKRFVSFIEDDQSFKEDSPLEFAKWHFRKFGVGSLMVYYIFGAACDKPKA